MRLPGQRGHIDDTILDRGPGLGEEIVGYRLNLGEPAGVGVQRLKERGVDPFE